MKKMKIPFVEGWQSEGLTGWMFCDIKIVNYLWEQITGKKNLFFNSEIFQETKN
jgi:hypothetical protein